MESTSQNVNAIHKTFNVTEWMKEAISEFLTGKGFEIVMFSIDSQILTRMAKMTILNNLSLKFIDKTGKNYSLQGYSSVSNEYDDLELKWLVDFIKERETEAILKFGGIALGTEINQHENKKVEFELVGKKTQENRSFSMLFASNVTEFMSFFLEKNFIQIWMGPTCKFEKDEMKFENVTIKDVKKVNDKCIELQYKWNDWDYFSPVSLTFLQIGDNVKVSTKLCNIPVEMADNVVNHWRERI